MNTKKIRFTKKLQNRYGLSLNKEIILTAEKELDYILIHHDDYLFFGYGSDVPSAMAMLAEDIGMIQEGFETGLINERNTDKEEYRLFEALFGKRGK